MSTKWGSMYSEPVQTPGQKFGEIFIVKKGKKINVREAINEANVDCEIYETLEKHNMINTHNRPNISELINQVGELTLMTSLEKIRTANDIWTNLPLSIRQEFNNDVHKFIDTGEEHFKNKIKMAEEKAKAEIEAKEKEEEEKRKKLEEK